MNLVGLKTAFKQGNERASGVHTYVVGLNPHGFIDGLTSSGDGALNEMINERLRIYEAQIGYPTDITPSNVKDVIKNSLMAFSALLQIKKWSDAKNLVLGNGKKLDIAKAIMPSNGITSAAMVLSMNSSGPTGLGWTEMILPNVTNTVWANLIGNLREVAILPPAIANLISYLTSNYFSNHYNDDDGVSQLIEFIPNHYDSFEQLLDLFNNGIEAVRTLYSDNPGLYSFMIQFIPNVELQDEDFRRDLSGRTITIIDDTKLLQAFDLDPSMYYSAGKDSLYTYGSEGIVASVFDSTPTQTLDIATVFYELIFKSATGSMNDAIVKVLHYVKTSADSGLENSNYYWAFPHGNLSNASLFSASSIGRMFDAMDRFPFDVIFLANYTFNEVTNMIQVGMSDANLKKGFNLYVVNGDDVGQVRDTWFKHAILGLELPESVNRVDNVGLHEEKPEKKKRNRKRKS